MKTSKELIELFKLRNLCLEEIEKSRNQEDHDLYKSHLRDMNYCIDAFMSEYVKNLKTEAESTSVIKNTESKWQ